MIAIALIAAAATAASTPVDTVKALMESAAARDQARFAALGPDVRWMVSPVLGMPADIENVHSYATMCGTWTYDPPSKPKADGSQIVVGHASCSPPKPLDVDFTVRDGLVTSIYIHEGI